MPTTKLQAPRARNLADPKGTRALVDRLRTTTKPTEFSETYSDAMGVVEDYVRRRMRMAQKARRAIDEWAERLPVGPKREDQSASKGAERKVGHALLIEINYTITDQINRHVAMDDTHREWLAKDICQRVSALVSELQRENTYLRGVLAQTRGHISDGHIDELVARTLFSTSLGVGLNKS